MIANLQLISSCTAMTGGADATAGVGEKHTLTIGGLWAADEEWTLYLTNGITSLQTLVGAGDLTGENPVFCFTYNDKEYLLAGTSVFFSASGLPTKFNDPSYGSNGFVAMSNNYSSPEDLIAVAPFQGNLAFYSRQTTQIWSTPPDPAEWRLVQVLPNIGTVAKLSVQSIGELEVLGLADQGVRSLRARESTLNAFVDDVGSPIDIILQPILAAATDGQKAAACGTVEPNSNRYWLFLIDTIYVLSNFRSSKVTAWSTYKPTYANGGLQTVFVPEKFVVRLGRLYARGIDGNIYLYGGVDNNTYDGCIATLRLPWLDIKSPGTIKQGLGIDVSWEGAWSVKVGMDQRSGLLQTVFADDEDTFMQGIVPFSAQGTHFSMEAVTTGATYARIGSLIFHFDSGEEK